eukprot:m.239300 g.239300  ORF g.239300 m.239300 type:complete len:5831 (+) comp40181_c2_seq5:266-17758(+)
MENENSHSSSKDGQTASGPGSQDKLNEGDPQQKADHSSSTVSFSLHSGDKLMSRNGSADQTAPLERNEEEGTVREIKSEETTEGRDKQDGKGRGEGELQNIEEEECGGKEGEEEMRETSEGGEQEKQSTGEAEVGELTDDGKASEREGEGEAGEATDTTGTSEELVDSRADKSVKDEAAFDGSSPLTGDGGTADEAITLAKQLNPVTEDRCSDDENAAGSKENICEGVQVKEEEKGKEEAGEKKEQSEGEKDTTGQERSRETEESVPLSPRRTVDSAEKSSGESLDTTRGHSTHAQGSENVLDLKTSGADTLDTSEVSKDPVDPPCAADSSKEDVASFGVSVSAPLSIGGRGVKDFAQPEDGEPMSFEQLLGLLGLNRCRDLLLEEDVDSINVMQVCNEECLDRMGVLRGHKRKIIAWQEGKLPSQFPTASHEDDETMAGKFLESAKCAKYGKQLLEEGFDDLLSLLVMEEKDPKEMKFTVGCELKLLKAVSQYKTFKRGSTFRAEISHQGTTDEELSFNKNEMIVFLENFLDGRCRGRLNDKEGLFPTKALPLKPIDEVSAKVGEGNASTGEDHSEGHGHEVKLQSQQLIGHRTKSDIIVSESETVASEEISDRASVESSVFKEEQTGNDQNQSSFTDETIAPSTGSEMLGLGIKQPYISSEVGGDGDERKRLDTEGTVSSRIGGDIHSLQGSDTDSDDPKKDIEKALPTKEADSENSEELDQKKSILQRKDKIDSGKALGTSVDQIEDEEFVDAPLPPETTEGVNVTFKALLHSEWNFKGNQEVCIRFGHPELGSFTWNTISMEITKTIATKEGKMLLMSGSFILPLRLSHYLIQYKYVVIEKDEKSSAEFEYLCEAKSWNGGVINRVFVLPKELRGRTEGDFIKYDNVVRKKPSVTTRLRFWERNSRFTIDREISIRAMLPKWSGFFPKHESDVGLLHMTAHEALTLFTCVILQLHGPYIIEDKTNQVYEWDLGLDISKLVSTVLKPKIAQLRKMEQGDDEMGVERVVSAAAIAVLVKIYDLKVESGQLDFVDFKSLASALALQPDMDNFSCPALKAVSINFPLVGLILEAVSNVCVQLCNKRKPAADWIMAIPLFHFCAHLSEPFKLPLHFKWNARDWWGLGMLESVLSIADKADAKFFGNAKLLLPLIRLDPFMLRVILFVSKIKDLKMWIAGASSASEIIVALVKKIEQRGFGNTSSDRPLIDALRETLAPLATKVLETKTDSEGAFDVIKTGIQASVHLLRVIHWRHFSRKEQNIVRQIVDLVLNHFKVLPNIQAARVRDQNTVAKSGISQSLWGVDKLEEAALYVAQWIGGSKSQTADIASDIKVWNTMLAADALSPDLARVWCDSLVKHLQQKLEEVQGTLILQTVSRMRNEQIHPYIDKCFASVAEAAVNEFLASSENPEELFNSYRDVAKSVCKESTTRFRQVLRNLLLKNFPSVDDTPPEDWLSNLVTWPLWRHYLRRSGELFPDGDPDVFRILAKAGDTLIDLVDKLAAGHVTIKEFQFCLKNKSKILDLCGVLVDCKTPSLDLLTRASSAFARLSEELRSFDEEKTLLHNFLRNCQSLGKNDLNELSARVRIDVSNRTIRSLAEKKDDGTVDVHCFEVPAEIKQYVKPLGEIKTSVIFQQLWRDCGDRVNEDRTTDGETGALPMRLDELVRLVIDPVFHQWHQTCKIVRTSEIVLKDVKEYFRNVLHSPRQLEVELNLMNLENPGNWVKERADQMLLYVTRNKIVDAARTILLIRSVLNATHDEENSAEVAESGTSSDASSKLPQPFPVASEAESAPLTFFTLAEICEEDSPEFHDKPLSVMTPDMVSAGKFLSDMTSEHVHCLQKFVSCEDLIKWVRGQIKEWKELETFVELAGTRSSEEGDLEAVKVADLRAACAGFAPLLFDLRKDSNLSQIVRACHAVFEKLERDDQISQKWVDTQKFLPDFKIMKEVLGSVEVTSFAQVELINSWGQYTIGCKPNETPETIADCISLDVRLSRSEGGNSPKKFTLNDLQDLESKLILISGHSSERQSEVNVFVDTLEKTTRLASNLLALCRAGRAKYFSWTAKFSCVSSIKQKKDESDNKVKTRIETLQTELQAVASEMEVDLKQWKTTMSETRSKYYYLNYFTTSQLLVLVRELGKLDCDRNFELANYVYGLLECIKPYVTVNDVNSAMKRTYSKQTPQSQASKSDFASQSSFGGEEIKIDGNSTFEGCWSGSSLQETPLPEGESKSKDTDESEDSDDSDYLSLEKLGIFLKSLAKSAPSRTFPADQLDLGAPNLVVVPETELIPTVLRFYMEDSHLPLPSAEEMLLCSPSTTLEAVTLFWRRSIEDPTRGRLFCLAGADRLNSEVSKEAVKELHRLSQGRSGKRGEKYRLVVVCCSENENKSYVVSALDQYRKFPLRCPSPQEVQEYLKAQFQRGPAKLKLRTATGKQWVPAASKLDYEQCCVRVVYSTRAGVGKSLFVKHMAEKLLDIPNNKQARRFEAGRDEPVTKIIVPLHESCVDTDVVLETLHPVFPRPNQALSRLIHFDISSSVREGLEEFLINLLILGQIRDSKGMVWRRRLTDMYVIECTWREDQSSLSSVKGAMKNISFERFLPSVRLGPPKEALNLMKRGVNPGIQESVLNGKEFGNSNFQRAFQYLSRYVKNVDLDPFVFKANSVEGTPPLCLETLLNNCGVPSPSWAMVRHFVYFLSSQMLDCEKSDFTNREATEEDLPGFKNFVMRLMIRMSRDFATPSLVGDLTRIEDVGYLDQYRMRRRWEQEEHPYLFFNEDRHSMTSIGLRITRDGWLADPRTGAKMEDLEEPIMSRDLSTALYTQGFRLQEDYETWTKEKKITALCKVMGLSYSEDEEIGDIQGRERSVSLFHSSTVESLPESETGSSEVDPFAALPGFQSEFGAADPDPFESEYGTPDPSESESEYGIVYPDSFPSKVRDDVAEENLVIATESEESGSVANAHERKRLCTDPDPTYELTTDNVLKILAIHMRFRCGIPVVIMGETGCGKTRLIRYMCALQARNSGAKNMLLMKVHGGITRKHIMEKVDQAVEHAELNAEMGLKTVLFFDEANTTEAVGLIKEIMCDKRINGKSIRGLGSDLHVIAACNPYRKHTEEMIKKLESAGLGYHARTGTVERLGDIPLRHLVYRVHPLPESLKALVWDFGQLNATAEKVYIRHIVVRHIRNQSLPNVQGVVEVISEVLAAAQNYMRNRPDECRFVSLRDVERALVVMVWFYKLGDVLEPAMQKKYDERKAKLEQANELVPLDRLTRSLVLALGVSYHARLQDRKPFRDAVKDYFKPPCELIGASTQIEKEIEFCQTVFLDELELPPKVGPNQALKENVFMMVVCINLRIPLFVVGKPGSSKSLAKDVVKTAMRGDRSTSDLYKRLKQVHMVSYQCSPISTADGIISTFQQCQKLQEKQQKELERFVSCVVLDEVGLAEDSPQLPLKALHPLLDDGTAGADDSSDEAEDTAEVPRAGTPKSEPIRSQKQDGADSSLPCRPLSKSCSYNRVAFVGISNWALDPAKMNRGILVQRDVPTIDELVVSAEGICSSDEQIKLQLFPYVHGMAKAYLEICEIAKSKEEKEFFGLRDFYSLVKMIFSFCKMKERLPTEKEIIHAIKRNFGGLDYIDPVTVFRTQLGTLNMATAPDPCDEGIDSTLAGLIRASLNKRGSCQDLEESRYLLLLTQKDAALTILRQHFLVGKEEPVIIFGSSFAKDQQYTQICRSINRVKVCMATGRTVVLLNLEKLYESLYDVLNQYYVIHGGQRFVDLGLGSHRLKCQVDKKFRLILIAERDVVYESFPIPLINRMEKHVLSMSSILTSQQQNIVEKLKKWVADFSRVDQASGVYNRSRKFTPSDAFVGYHSDAPATMVLQVCRHIAQQEKSDELNAKEQSKEWEERVFKESCQMMLACAAPDAVARLLTSRLRNQASSLWNNYFEDQCHSSLAEYLECQLHRENRSCLFQVTTYSRLLSNENVKEVGRSIGLSTEFISLQQFDTEQHFCSRVAKFFSQTGDPGDKLLIVSCEAGDVNEDLVACARYLVQEQRGTQDEDKTRDGEKTTEPQAQAVCRHVVFVIHLPRVVGGCFDGFRGGPWTEVHIDDLRPAKQARELSITSLVGRRLSTLFGTVPDQRADSEGSEVDETEAKVRFIHQDAVVSAAVLLRSCVHEAVSRLDDPAGTSSKSANTRLCLLLRLLPENEAAVALVPMFYTELKRRVVKLLADKEEWEGEERSREWVKNEALSQNSVQAGGTFRHSLWLRVVKVVTPILAEVIAFMDADSNLVLLQEAANGSPSWRTDLWLEIFSSSQLTPLHYTDFLSPTEHQLRQRILVKGSGYQGHVFDAQFPFSKLVKDEVNGVIDKAKELAGGESFLKTLERLFDESVIGKVIKEIQSHQDREDLAKAYLHDFVEMTYNPRSSKEFELVFNAMLSGFKELTADVFATRDVLTRELTNSATVDVLTIPVIHATYENIRIRLNCCSSVIALNPSVVSVAHQKLGSVVTEKMALDTVSFFWFLEQLTPSSLSVKNARLQWIEKVQKAKPLMEAWLALPLDERLPKRAASRAIWTKVCIVRLYFEHTKCLQKSEFVIEAGERLWKRVKNHNLDFSTAETVKQILEFLNESSQFCNEKMFGPNKIECAFCTDVWKDPVQLPCQHIFCQGCITDWIGEQHTCPNCRAEMPPEYQLQPSQDLAAKAVDFVTFRSCCTAFFMELVAVYTFSEQAQSSPQDDLVNLLMELVAQRQADDETATRAFSPFQSDTIDSTPTVRSFLLQLLLRYSGQKAVRHVEKYFENARETVTRGTVLQKDEEEMAAIFIQCDEDSVFRNAARSYQLRFKMALTQLEQAVENLKEDQHSLVYLRAVAAARFGLCLAAEVILQLLRENDELSQEAEDLLNVSEQLCTYSDDQQALFFLLKQLVKLGGIDVLSQLEERHKLAWLDDLVRQHTQEGEETIPDYCVVLGDNYKQCREAVAAAVRTISVDSIERCLSLVVSGSNNAKAVFFLLALHREVTMREAYAGFSREVAERAKSVLEEHCCSSPAFAGWPAEIGNHLIHNNLSGGCLPSLMVIPRQSNQTRAAATVALHVLLAIEAGTDNLLMRPLVNMLKHPERLTKAYFPTMPDDNFLTVKGAARGDVGTKWVECPNGHPYLIDDCGNANTAGKCVCGAIIGGADSQLHALNVATEREQDATETGHILGKADMRSDTAPERKLSSQSCAYVRLLMHAALMWASCNENRNLALAVAQIVKPDVPVDQLCHFFWDHFEKDLKGFAEMAVLSLEDACVVIHQLLNYLVTQQQHVEVVADGLLATKQEREDWETNFSRLCVDPVLRTLERNIERWVKCVWSDEIVASNSLMRWVNELEDPPGAKSPSVYWRFQDRITINHLDKRLQQECIGKPEDQQPEVLKEFLKEERNLRALQYLPQIMQLQRMLSDKFHRRLSLREATTLTVGEFLQSLQGPEKEEFKKLIDVFKGVWIYLGREILSHGRLKPKTDEDKLLKVSDRTSIAFLLPTTTGKGCCAMSLLDYLINCVQNEFIARFRRISGLEKAESKVPMNEVTQAQLIYYDVDRDLLPLVLAHCRYSLEVGKGTDITYDFAALERQLVDRFLSGKPQIRFEAKEFSFSGGAHTTVLFARVKEKIRQEKLTAAVSNQIISELPDLREVYSVLSVVDVVIGFIVSTGGDKEKLLHDYLHNILQMPIERGLVSPTAQQYCKLKHVLSLWRLLMVEKGKKLVLRHRDPFEEFPGTFKEDMDDTLKLQVKEFLQRIDLEQFMGELMELAWLHLKNRSDINGLEDYSIKEALEDFCNSKLKGLGNIPAEMKVRHFLNCWGMTVEHQASLKTQ